MPTNMTDKQELKILEEKIKLAEQNGQSIEKYILREIEILQNAIDTFVKQAKERNNLDEFDIGEIQIRQYAMMKQLAQKINYSTEEFDEEITKIKKNLFGEENYNNFFGEDKSVSEI